MLVLLIKNLLCILCIHTHCICYMYECVFFIYMRTHTHISATPGHQRAALDSINRSTTVQFCSCSQVNIAAQLLQLCLTLCNSTDCSLPGSSVHRILYARILDWVAMPSCRGSSRPRDQTRVFCIVGRFFTAKPPGKSQVILDIRQHSFRTLSGNHWFFYIYRYRYIYISFFLPSHPSLFQTYHFLIIYSQSDIFLYKDCISPFGEKLILSMLINL